MTERAATEQTLERTFKAQAPTHQGITRALHTLSIACALCATAWSAQPASADTPPPAEAPTPAAPTTEAAPAAPALPPHFWLNLLDPQRQAAEQLMRRGALAFKREHYVSALRAFEEAATRAPHLLDARLFAGLTAERLKQHARAITHFEAFREAVPTADASHDLCFHIAIAASHLGQWARTITEYERCLAAAAPDAPRRLIYLGNLAETYMATGRLADAIRTYEAALAVDPTLVHALLGLGVALARADQPERAEPLLRLGLLQDPALEEMTGDDVFFIPPGDGYFHLGLMLEAVNRVEDARRYYKKFIERLPDSPYIATARARLEGLAGRRSPLVKTLPSPTSQVTTAAVDPGLTWLALGTAQGQLTLLRLDTLAVTQARAEGPRVIDLAFTADGAELRALLADGTVLRLDPRQGLKPVGAPVGLGAAAAIKGPRRALSLSADGAGAVILEAPNTLELWTGLGSKQPAPPARVAAPVDEPLMAAAPSGGAGGSAMGPFVVRGQVGYWLPGVGAGTDAVVTTPATVGITDAEVSPGGGFVVAATPKGLIVFGRDGQPLHLLLPPGDPTVQALTLEASGRYLVAVSRSTIQVWDLGLLVSSLVAASAP